MKLRALGLTQYHSVLLVDADVAVVGPLAPLWSLPAEFAAVWDQSRWLSRCVGAGARRLWVGSGPSRGMHRQQRACEQPAPARRSPLTYHALPPHALRTPRRWRTAVERINGGVLLLRPCAAAQAHMLSLLERRPKLRFTHAQAEQSFLSWCGRTRARWGTWSEGLVGRRGPRPACPPAVERLLPLLRSAHLRCPPVLNA